MPGRRRLSLRGAMRLMHSGATSELRRDFLNFFELNGHARLPSSSLVPVGDASLLFTNAGMVQFKEVQFQRPLIAFRPLPKRRVRRCFSDTQLRRPYARLPPRSACASAANITISTMSASHRGITPSSRCSGISRSAGALSTPSRADHRRRGVRTRARRYGREEAIVLAWKFLTANLQVRRLCLSMSMRAAALRMQA